MKLRFALIPLLAAAVASAAPVETPDHWIGDRAQAVIDRVEAAYGGLKGWTAEIRTEEHDLSGGADKAAVSQAAERYLKGDGLTGLYSLMAPKGMSKWQTADAHYDLMQGPKGATLQRSQPDVYSRPSLWEAFDLGSRQATEVRYAGQERLAGEVCDVVELDNITSPFPAGMAKNMTHGAPASLLMANRYYVNPKGFIVRSVSSSNFREGSWTDTTVTAFDPGAALTADDFSFDRFQKAAAAVLGDRPMPEIGVREFAPGESLPAARFVLWGGKPFEFSELKGKVVVIETWASWCHFCKAAFPYYEKMRQKLASNPDVVFAAMSFDDKQADYDKWMKEHGDSYGFLFGRVDTPAKDGAEPARAGSTALSAFKGSLPGFYILGRDGKISSAYTGFGNGVGGPDPRLDEALKKAGVAL
jgi:thiol-disulfide isomerase/thioredoxin